MERATKERLTGAVILVAALAILVPEMLSGPGDPAVSDEAGVVADTGPPLTTYDLAIDPAGAPAAARQQQLSGVTSQAEAIAQAVPPPVIGPTRPDGVGNVEKPAADTTNPASDEPPVSQPPVSQPPVSVPATAARVAAQTPAKAPAAAVSPAAESRASNAATGNWWVQLGSFSSAQNAQGLARKLRASGYAIEVTVVRSGGKDLHRVRAGPARDRADATALRTRLAAAGQQGTLVAP